jgi:oligosaccharide repeat unit polymerase
MYFLLALIALWVSLILYFLIERHYIAAGFNLIVGLYELTGPFFFYIDLSWIDLSSQRIFNIMASSKAVDGFVVMLLIFFISMNLTYIILKRSSRLTGWPANTGYDSDNYNQFDILALCIFIVLSGIIAFNVEAGYARLLDYTGSVEGGSRIFSYGIVLIIPLFTYIFHFFYKKKLLSGISLLICCLPLAYQIFLTGRRQSLAPIGLILYLFIFYREVKFKYLWSVILTVCAVIFMGFQFSLRELISGSTTSMSDSVLSGSLTPQFGEFGGVGSISFWAVQLLTKADLTYGFHFLLAILNSIPFLKMGDIFFPSYTQELQAITKMLSPWGGFTMIAESYLAFGIFGILLLGVVLGVLLRFFHNIAIRSLYKESISYLDVYWISLIAIILLKYRSGISDAFFAFTTFTILFYFVHKIGNLFIRPFNSFTK